MDSKIDPGPHRPGVEGVHEVARVITLYGTLTFLAVVCFFLIVESFNQGFSSGFRSFAAVLFPIIIGSYLFVFNKDVLVRVGQTPTTMGFILGLIFGALVMLSLRFFDQSSGLPVSELVTSGCFAALVFSSSAVPGDQSLSYYYGSISGMLLYIIFLGFPLSR